MTCFRLFATVVTCLLIPASGVGQTMLSTNGDDTFVAGETVTETLETPGDAFVGGRTTAAGGQVAGDLHVSGFDVVVSADVGADLYAAGATVSIRSDVAEDLSAAGYSVRTEAQSETSGNARLMGASVTIDGPVAGSLAVMGRDVLLNAPVDGDVRIFAKSIRFGDAAAINGTLTYTTETEISVPPAVAPENRVRFEAASDRFEWDEMEELWERQRPMFMPALISLFAAFVITIIFFIVLGAVFLTFLPKPVAQMRRAIAAAPGQTALLGVIGLAMLFGMVPIIGMTIIGLPFLPVVLLAIVVAWTLGYLLGGYAVAMRAWQAFGGHDDPSTTVRLIVLAVAVVVVALLNYIPFVGWVVNYTLVLLGIGAMTHMIFQRLIGPIGPELDADMKPIED